jgi:hypothetical protein
MRYFSLLPLLGLAAAAPLNEKRDVVIQDLVITEFVTTTIWIDPADPTPAAFFEHKSSSSSSASSSSSSPAPTSTSTPPPAAPSTPAAAAPSPAAAPAIAAAAAPPPASGGPSGSGQLTFYNVGMGIGSCGMPQASSSDHVVAVAAPNMQAGYNGNPNSNPLCGKTITITCNGVTGTGTVYDTCPECPPGNLDLSQGFFDMFGSESTGRLDGATWTISG